MCTFYWLTLHNCNTMHDTNNIEVLRLSPCPLLNFRRRGNSQKNTNYILNTAKVSKLQYVCCKFQDKLFWGGRGWISVSTLQFMASGATNSASSFLAEPDFEFWPIISLFDFWIKIGFCFGKQRVCQVLLKTRLNFLLQSARIHVLQWSGVRRYTLQRLFVKWSNFFSLLN